MAHDVFISYASEDKPTADAVCAILERHGIRCWIAPRDILPGQEYAGAIGDAIAGAHAMVLVFSSHADASAHVHRELDLAVEQETLIVPLRIEDVVPSSSIRYYIGGAHWLDALTPPLERHVESLASTIAAVMRSADGTEEEPRGQVRPDDLDVGQAVPDEASWRRHRKVILGVGAGIAAIVVLIVVVSLLGGSSNDGGSAATDAPGTTVSGDSERLQVVYDESLRTDPENECRADACPFSVYKYGGSRCDLSQGPDGLALTGDAGSSDDPMVCFAVPRAPKTAYLRDTVVSVTGRFDDPSQVEPSQPGAIGAQIVVGCRFDTAREYLGSIEADGDWHLYRAPDKNGHINVTKSGNIGGEVSDAVGMELRCLNVDDGAEVRFLIDNEVVGRLQDHDPAKAGSPLFGLFQTNTTATKLSVRFADAEVRGSRSR